MKILASAVMAALLGGALLPTAAAAQPQQACLQQSMVNGWKVVNNQTLIVSDRVGRQYTVSLAKGCTDLKWPMALGFNSGLPGDSGLACLTRNDFVTVPASGGAPRQRCLISNVQPYGGPMPGSTAMNNGH